LFAKLIFIDILCLEATRAREFAEDSAAATPEERDKMFMRRCEDYGLVPNYGTEPRLVVRRGWISTFYDLDGTCGRWFERYWKTEPEDESDEDWEFVSENEQYHYGKEE
jgi:ABC-type ATPase with predicted acetyltransferase domain